MVLGVLGSYLETARDMAGNEFLGILTGVGGGQQQVIADAAADIDMLDSGHAIDSTVELD